jgi:hypothetical protein
MARGRRARNRKAYNQRCARVVAATLDDVKAFRTAKGGAPNNGKDPVVIELRRTRGMSKRTFDRKARALEKLGQEGKLVRHKVPKKRSEGEWVRNRDGSITKDVRHKKIKEVTSQHEGDSAAQKAAKRPYETWDTKNEGQVNRKGQMQDPDHIHELQLGGADDRSNLRWEDSYTQRKIGLDLKRAMDDAGVDYGTPVIIRVVD